MGITGSTIFPGKKPDLCCKGNCFPAGLAGEWGTKSWWGEKKLNSRVASPYRSWGCVKKFLLASLADYTLLTSSKLTVGLSAYTYSTRSDRKLVNPVFFRPVPLGQHLLESHNSSVVIFFPDFLNPHYVKTQKWGRLGPNKFGTLRSPICTPTLKSVMVELVPSLRGLPPALGTLVTGLHSSANLSRNRQASSVQLQTM